MTAPLLSIVQARALVAEAAQPLPDQAVPLRRALGRALARDVRAVGDVPPFANSAMDGFAVKSGPAGRRLRIVAESRAGAPAPIGLAGGEAVRISTGAALPLGAEAVTPLEQAHETEPGWVVVDSAAVAGSNLRGAGDDMRAGELVLARGRRLGAADLGVAVAAGRATVRCARRPRVAILCTGDELRRPGERLGPGEIHNSNAVTLEALARRAGALVAPAEVVHDDRESTTAALGHALRRTDVVIVSGGVSVGPHDHVKDALASLGVEQRFWRVALRPGKPTWFGVRPPTLVFALPGNPVSAMVTFQLFVLPALRAMQGLPAVDPPRRATLGETLARNRDRDEAVRVSLREGEGGAVAVATGPQASHRLTSMVGADGLLIVAAGAGEVPAGTEVLVEPIG